MSGIASLPALGEGAAAPAGGLKVLVLGGTGYLGPHLVRALLAGGHTPTLFNRGKSDPHLFPNVETIIGDRGSKLKGLRKRKWDIVIDTSSFWPNQVAFSAKVLRKHIGHYIYISSTSVYKDLSSPGVSEDSPVYSMSDPDAGSFEAMQSYGAAKYGSELAAEAAMPGKTTSIRSDTIVGPGDNRHFRYTYWIRRASQPGEILAPGKPSHFVQYIDVRDLAEWIVYCAENSVYGTFNATSEGGAYTMESMIQDCQTAADTSAPLVWADGDFLVAQGVQDIPFWFPKRDELAGVGQLSAAKAMKNGLKERPKLQTARDTFAWFSELPEDIKNFEVGVSLEQEAQLIAAWKNRSS